MTTIIVQLLADISIRRGKVNSHFFRSSTKDTSVAFAQAQIQSRAKRSFCALHDSREQPKTSVNTKETNLHGVFVENAVLFVARFPIFTFAHYSAQ